MGYEVTITEYSNLTDLQTTNVDITEMAGIGTNTTEVIIVEGTNIGFVQVDAATAEAKNAAAAAKVSEQNAKVTLANAVQKTGAQTMAGPLAVEGILTTNSQLVVNDPTATYGQRLVTAGSVGYLQSGKLDRDVTDQKLMLSGWYGTDLSYLRFKLASGTNPQVAWGSSSYDILHRGNMPTAEEIKAMAVYDRPTGDDCNNAIMPGNYGIFANTANTPHGIGPSGSTLLVTRWGNGANAQIFFTYGEDRVFVRRQYIGVWKPWFELYSTVNKPTAADVGTLTTAQIETALALKSDLSYVNTELGKKSDLTYVNTELGKKSDLTYVNTELGKKLNLSGGTLTGALIVANTKGAIKVDSQKSISFQDQSGTMYHLLSEGNNFKIKHGNLAEHPIFDISPSAIAANTSFYSRTGLIIQDPAGTKWLGLETPAGTDPYISVRSAGDTQNRVAMKFEKGAIRLVTDTLVAPSMLVQNNGGLVFSAESSRPGLSWGMGLDGASGDLCFHRYNNAQWAALSVIIKADGTLYANSGMWTSIINCTGNANIDGSIGVKQSVDVRGGYMSLTNASNTLLEFHTPGRTAAMIYKGPEGNMRFVSSNGSGGETLLRMQLDTSGNMSVAGAVWATSFNPGSDRRIKSNIVTLENCLEKNAKIIPCSYNKRGLPDDKREVGVIAQDVIQCLPDAVSEGPDGFYGVNYASVTSLNTGAINELHELVKQLQEEIRILKSK